MPTVWREAGFRFVIFLDDHDPPHVHVFKGGGEAKVWLQSAKVEEAKGLRDHELSRIERLVKENAKQLLGHWRSIHGIRN